MEMKIMKIFIGADHNFKRNNTKEELNHKIIDFLKLND